MRNLLDRPVGVVLAGGASLRMGQDKARLELEGRSLVELAAEKLVALTPEVVIADRHRGLTLRWSSVADGPGRGPVAGLLGAAAAFPGRTLMALACDMPAVPRSLLRALIQETCWDWVVPQTARGPEPLCAVYGPAALMALARRVEAGRFALHELLFEKELAVRTLSLEDLRRYGDPEEMLANVNTPEDWGRLRQMHRGVDPA